MQFSEEPFHQKYVIRRVDEQGVLINDTLYKRSVMIDVDEVLADWPVPAFNDLTASTLALLLTSNPDIIIIGTGNASLRLPPDLLALCWQQHIGVETMTTASAAKTYNLLVNEGRKVSAGLIVL